MRSIHGFMSGSIAATVIGVSVIVLITGSALRAGAVDMSCNYDGGNIRLSVPGLYYDAWVERSEGSPNGATVYLGHRYYGCTEACEFLDQNVVEGTTYWYRMSLTPQYGSMIRLGPTRAVVPPLTARVLESRVSPNPFIDEVTVRFRIPNRLATEGSARVIVTILDMTGRVVRTLHQGAMSRGEQTLSWDGRDGSGRSAATGVYLYSIQAGATRETGRLIKLE